jgi:transcriptional regulator with XRE-family HTH domain
MHNGWDADRFRDLLKRIMDEASLSQQDVAAMAGISRPQVSRWTTGAHRPNFDALQRFAAAARARHLALAETVDELVLAAGYEPAATVVSSLQAQFPEIPEGLGKLIAVATPHQLMLIDAFAKLLIEGPPRQQEEQHRRGA